MEQIYGIVRRNDIDEFKTFLDSNPSVVNTVYVNENWTLLHLAVWHNHVDLCRILIENGAVVDIKDTSNCTPLYSAVVYGYFDICCLLIENGADVHTKSKLGDSLLHLAVSFKHLNTCRLLIENGVDINARDRHGHTPLRIAAITGNSKICHLLVQHGSQVTLKDIRGKCKKTRTFLLRVYYAQMLIPVLGRKKVPVDMIRYLVCVYL